MKIIDLFAGPGGGDEGLRLLGRGDVIGVEWDASACATAQANGHEQVQGDVSALDPREFADIFLDEVEGFIASPPCQAWSLAGKRGGEHDRQACHDLADRMALLGDDSIDFTEWADPRSHLVTQPVRWVRDLRPEWIALEEVPAVKGLWEHFAEIFRSWGYSVDTGVLQAEAYGVPQTRKRAILVASRVAPVKLPRPTHSRYYPRTPDKLDPGVKKWVSMYEALTRGFEDRPSPTISSGGTATGGEEPIANRKLRDQLADVLALQNNQKPISRQGEYMRRSIDEPAMTITGSANRSKWMLRGSSQAHAAVGPFTAPALTMLFGHALNDVYPDMATARPGGPCLLPSGTSGRGG